MSYIAIARQKIRYLGNASQQRKINAIVLAMGVVEPLFTLPQAYNIWVKHEVAGVSLVTWIFFTIAAIVWCFYGITINSRPLIISYALYTVFNGIVLIGLLTQ
jgi:uncharacterized protein with PQ loop repeat